MSASLKLSSASVWYAVALLLLTTPWLGHIDGYLFPVVDKEKTVITSLDYDGEYVQFAGTSIKVRRCDFRENILTINGVTVNASRLGAIGVVEIGKFEFGPFRTVAKPEDIVCKLRMVNRHSCYSWLPWLFTYSTMYEGEKSTDQRCIPQTQEPTK